MPIADPFQRRGNRPANGPRRIVRGCSKLIALGRVRAAGLSEIERAKKDGRWEAAYARQSTAEVPDDLRLALSKSKRAKAFFETLDSKNRFAILYRIHDAKKPRRGRPGSRNSLPCSLREKPSIRWQPRP